MPKVKTLIESPNGSVIGVNKKRLLEVPYYLLPNPPFNSVAMAANQGSLPTPMTLSGEGPVQILGSTAQRTGVCRVFISLQDGDSTQALMNGSIHVDTIFGGFGPGLTRPYFWPEALYLDEGRSLILTASDISGSANAIRPCFLCSRYLGWESDPGLVRIRNRMEGKQYLSRPFFYTFNSGPITLPGGAAGVGEIDIGQDHHFEMFQLSAVSTGAFSMNIVDANKGESLVVAPQETWYNINSPLFVGNNFFPFRLHEPVFFEARSKINVNLFNLTPAENRIDLTLGGRILALKKWI